MASDPPPNGRAPGSDPEGRNDPATGTAEASPSSELSTAADPFSSTMSSGGSDGRWLRRALWIYLLLLFASHLFRLVEGRFSEPDLGPDHQALAVAEVDVVDGETMPTGRDIRLAYLEWLPPASDAQPSEGRTSEVPTLLLVHGSPGSGSNFDRLGPLLAEEGFRVIAPDLPGFGASSARVADYSIRAHAEYCRQLLDSLGLDTVHAVGFSLGGGVVLELFDDRPESIRSLTLLAAVGVQELELLGQYGINHAIHGVQWITLLALQEGFPHFGLLDRTHSHLSYARNFFDSDQRPLREILEGYGGPMLILHGENDVLVPYSAALEHRRIVPQSELVTYDANHFMVFRDPEGLAAPLVAFFREVEAGSAPTRATAEPARVADAADGIPLQLPQATGPTLVVWFLLLIIATFVSEDLTCIAAGLLVARGSLAFGPAVLACAVGIFVGDLGLYLIGRVGRPFLDRAPLRWWIDPEGLKRSARWFESRGGLVILLSRFLPGTRIPTYVSAGLLGMHPLRFSIYLLIPVAIWTPLLVFLAKFLGERFFDTFEVFQAYALPAFAGLLISVWLIMAFGRSLFTWAGRRRLVGAWRRWRHWEFWPPWLFYPPVIVYLLGLAMRYRSVTLFTAANPGIPAGGGFVGESKSQILERIRDPRVAPWRLLPHGESQEARVEAALAFAEQQGGLPVVLKPDVGQRGSGVVVARDEAAIRTFVTTEPGPAIVQRYVPGVELGVFWIRLPGEPNGRIFSITDKRLPEVEGDGVSTVERLVLADPRAVTLASTYLSRFAGRLDAIPAAGERIRLVDLGTHCRGAVFLDGEDYRGPGMEEEVDAIARSFEGFYFGRFDLRAPSYEHFRRGEEMQVLELNGVTSEATHIYDPKNSLFAAYRVLFEQWRWAFEIGKRNRERGDPPATVGELIRMAIEFGRGGTKGG